MTGRMAGRDAGMRAIGANRIKQLPQRVDNLTESFRSKQLCMALPILVCDDSTLARKLLIRSLPTDWDVTISEATNGADALAAYHEGRASVMFLDLTMPGMTGFDVLDQLRREDLNTFVVVVSADVQQGARERALESGAIAFVDKPVSPEKLLPILKEYGLYE
jgi:two-component system, chemotaxis family, chemotaxis protein CheY